MGGEL